MHGKNCLVQHTRAGLITDLSPDLKLRFFKIQAKVVVLTLVFHKADNSNALVTLQVVCPRLEVLLRSETSSSLRDPKYDKDLSEKLLTSSFDQPPPPHTHT